MNKEAKSYKTKMSAEELQAYLAFRRHGFAVPAKKGKGSYDRKKAKKEW
jgi:stalled ribosome alternative rescue factor ArfA